MWLTGGALAFALLMVTGLVGLILYNGLGFFWPAKIQEFAMKDGLVVLGQVTAREAIPDPGAPPGTKVLHRIQVKRGNRDLYGSDFIWLNEADVVSNATPPDAVMIEREEWGNFYGRFQSLEKQGGAVSNPAPPAGFAATSDWNTLRFELEAAAVLKSKIRRAEKKGVGAVSEEQERVRLALRRLEFKGVTNGPAYDGLVTERKELQGQYAERLKELTALRGQSNAVLLLTAAGHDGVVRLSALNVVRICRPNNMSVAAKCGHYLAKLWEFVSTDPRESNTEGGVFPAIFGTVLMVLIMSLVVTPLGVIAAFYLREYARQGLLVSAVRIAVNNLAGVPSIVFGVFGVGFFIYFVGGSIDRIFYPERLPTPTFGTGGILWASLTLALLTVPVVIVATEEGLATVSRGTREASLALGATKFETEWRVVLPAVTPAILTGLILAMARAAGEVAPLMITGVVKLAPALPVDASAPFLHLDRKFMHLGFHIYDVGFQSPNVDAARPMVYVTTILLLTIVVLLNLAAILIRAKLRKKYTVTHL